MEKIAALLQEAAELSGKAAGLASAGDIDHALALESQADRLRKRARREARVSHQVEAPMPSDVLSNESGMSARQLTISALNEIGVPSPPRLVSDYSHGRFGVSIDPRHYAALRRDERRAWNSSASHRPVHIVPALEGRFFSPMRGKLTLSDWELLRRIIGPWSERVDQLNATINISRQVRWMQQSGSDVGELLEVLRRNAATIPGAIGANSEIDPQRTEDAAGAELSMLEEQDLRWRRDAAARGQEILSTDELLLWGAKPLELIQRNAG